MSPFEIREKIDLIRKSKFSFRIKFSLFIFLFSILMASLIYWKEASLRNEIYFFEVVFWQLMIWVPWVLFVPILRKTILKINARTGIAKNMFLLIYFLVPVVVHWSWFVAYSSYFSPYLAAPSSRFGVFSYFFIFWGLIDLILLVSISVYFVLYKKDSSKLEEKPTSIQVVRGNKKVLLKNDTIYWISANGYYINLHTNQGQFLLRRRLKDIFDTLPKSDFVQIHRSAIVNIHHITELHQPSGAGISVQMKDGKSHSVSRAHVKNLKEILKGISH